MARTLVTVVLTAMLAALAPPLHAEEPSATPETKPNPAAKGAPQAGSKLELAYGLRFLKVREYPTAILHLTAAINARDLPPPLLSDAHYFRGRALIHTDQADLAMKDLAQAILFWPENVKVLRLRCRMLTLKDKFEDAANDCDQAVQLAPEDWRGWFTRGLLYDRQKDRPKALADLAEAQKRMPKGMDTFPTVYRPLRAYGLLPSNSPPPQPDSPYTPGD